MNFVFYFIVGTSFCLKGDNWQYRSLNLVFPCFDIWVITLSLLLLKMEKKNILLKQSFANSMFLIGKSSRLSWVYHPVNKYGEELEQLCIADFARIWDTQSAHSLLISELNPLLIQSSVAWFSATRFLDEEVLIKDKCWRGLWKSCITYSRNDRSK